MSNQYSNESYEDKAVRFWSKVDRTGGDDACWEWKASTATDGGYGRVGWCGKNLRAHRVAYALTKGDPGKLCVCHSCDNPKCCNPNHLWLGTKKENRIDCVKKGRLSLHAAKLSKEQVVEIRQRYSCGDITQYQLANEYNVGKTAINNIVRKLTWKNI